MPTFPPNGSALGGFGPVEIYTSSSGSDNGSGSPSSPKKTLYGAYAELITRGGGTIYVGENTTIGGPVEGQGLWIRGDGLDVPGFLQQTKARIIGNGHSSGNVFETPGAARFYGSDEDDPYKPALWMVQCDDTPSYFGYLKSYRPNFRGLAANVRLGWDYCRRDDYSLNDISVTNATRSSGSTVLTLNLATAQSFDCVSASRTSNVVTVTLQLPDTMNRTPWYPGALIRVTTADTDFPSVDATVVTQSDSVYTTPGNTVQVVYAQNGDDKSGQPLVGTITAHGCQVNDRISLQSSNAQFASTTYRVTAVTIGTVTVRDYYGYGSRSASANQNNIGTMVKQERGRAAVNSAVFENCSFFGDIRGGEDERFGPTVDIGCVSAIPLRFENCFIQGGLIWPYGDVSASNVDFDRTMVAILGDPGVGPAGCSFYGSYNKSNEGCIRHYARTSSSGALVDLNHWLQDSSGTARATYQQVTGEIGMTLRLNDIATADTDTEAITLCSGMDPARVKIGYVYSTADPPISGGTGFIGPEGIASALWYQSQSTLPTPWKLGWTTFWPGGISTFHPAAVRAMGPVAARSGNLVPALPGSWTIPGGITLTQNASSPDGNSIGYKFVNGGTQDIAISAEQTTAAFENDGYVAVGTWIKNDTGIFGGGLRVVASNNLTFNTPDSPSTAVGTISAQQHIGQHGWQWAYSYGKIVAAGDKKWKLSLVCPNGTTSIWGMTVAFLPAAVGDADAYEFFHTLKHQPLYLAAGMAGTMESQKFIAHGGLGIATGITNTVGVGSGQLTLTGTGTIYEPRYGADGTTILGWTALLQATINP